MRFSKKLPKLFLWLSLTVFAVWFFWGRKFFGARRHYQTVCVQRERLEAEVKRRRPQVERKRYFIRKLMTDADFRERVAREQTNYVGENEYVVYFLEGEHLENRKKGGKNP